MGSESWDKLFSNINILQNHLFLPTVLSSLQRKGVVSQIENEGILELKKEEQISCLLNLIQGKDNRNFKIMCDTIQETQPAVMEEVGLPSETYMEAGSQDPDHNLVLKSYHAVLEISTNPLVHADDNSLHHSDSTHAAFI